MTQLASSASLKIGLLGGLVALGTMAAAQEVPHEAGKVLYEEHCELCHEHSVGGAPTFESMSAMPRDRVLESMVSGVMEIQASDLSDAEKGLVADYLAALAATVEPKSESTLVRCADASAVSTAGGAAPSAGAVSWSSWGVDQHNRRYVADAEHSFTRDSVANLELQWAFGFPGAVRARSQPTVTATMIYVGSQDGTVFALDRASGCVWWTFQAEVEVRSSMAVETTEDGAALTLYFGDFAANVYAVEANTGALRWKRKVADHKDGTITGSVVIDGDLLFVPMSSTEIISAYYKEYECCSFRGGVLALRASDGEEVWRMYTTDSPTKRKLNSAGVQQWGPSGAPVWSTLTVDTERELLYFGTGENYSSPANEMSDAIIAVKRETGEILWVRQTTRGDAWNGACVVAGVNCPEEDGPDFDFGAPPILARVKGKDYLLAGQKSGMIYALDPDDAGKILWQRRLGMGGFNGGVHWGMAVSGSTLVVPITDTPGNRFTTGDPRPGLHALDIATGEELWSTFHRATCTGKRECYFHGLSAAPTVTDQLAFASSLYGVLGAYDLKTGERIWSFDTRREFSTVNGVAARGGSIDSDGAVIAGDQLLVNSGYDKWGQFPGNVLLVFGLPEGAGE